MVGSCPFPLSRSWFSVRGGPELQHFHTEISNEKKPPTCCPPTAQPGHGNGLQTEKGGCVRLRRKGENKGGGWIRPLSWRRCRPQQQQQQQQLSVRNQVVFGLSPHYSTQSRRSSSQVLLRRQKTFGSLAALGFLSAWDFAGCRQLCRERPADRKT